MISGSVFLLCVTFTIILGKSSGVHHGFWPTLFHQDNYDACFSGSEPLYCSFKYTLQPAANSFFAPPMLKHIMDTSEDIRSYRHDILRHSICVPTTCPNLQINNSTMTNLTKKLTECYDEIYKPLSLSGEITDLDCVSKKSSYSIDFADELFRYFVIAYLILIVLATLLDLLLSNDTNEVRCTDRVLRAFSIPRNWNRLKTIKSTPEVERLRVIQGLRFYNTITVMLTHTVMLNFMLPISNPDITEGLTERWSSIFLSSGTVSVAMFFMISAWLLIDRMLSDFEGGKKLSLKSLFLIFVHRYIRLTPTYALVLWFHATWLRHMGDGPNWNHYIGRESLHCQLNWWANLLYINNFVDVEHLCLPTTWYLTLDTQYFAVILLIIMVIIKYPKTIWYLLTSILMIATVLAFYENYIHDFPVLIVTYPEIIYDMSHIFKGKQFRIQYISIFGNFTSSLVGLGFGYIYHKTKGRKIFTRKVHTVLWWIISFGVSFGPIIVAGILGLSLEYDHDTFWASFYTSISRMLCSFAVAFGILGVSNGIGGYAKDIFEWRPLYVLGRLSYSAYLVHIPLILVKSGQVRYPLYVNDYYLFCELVGNLALSYLIATVLTLLFEMPLYQFHKALMSSDSTSSEETQNHKKKKNT